MSSDSKDLLELGVYYGIGMNNQIFTVQPKEPLLPTPNSAPQNATPSLVDIGAMMQMRQYLLKANAIYAESYPVEDPKPSSKPREMPAIEETEEVKRLRKELLISQKFLANLRVTSAKALEDKRMEVMALNARVKKMTDELDDKKKELRRVRALLWERKHRRRVDHIREHYERSPSRDQEDDNERHHEELIRVLNENASQRKMIRDLKRKLTDTNSSASPEGSWREGSGRKRAKRIEEKVREIKKEINEAV